MISVIRRTLRSSYLVPVGRNNLLLDQFARNSGNSKVAAKLTEYMDAKGRYDELIAKYEIFGAKETSVRDAARMVGLEVPPKTNS